MATKLKIEYIDGREVELLASARAQVDTERHFHSTDQARAQQIESSFYLAWAALRHTGKESGEYEEWLDKVADVEIVDKTVEDERATDPTPAAASPTGSSD